MQFNVLGPFEACRSGGPVQLSPKLRSLLAALLCRPNTAVAVDTLIDVVWGADPPPSAAGSLRIYVHHLRQAVGAHRIRREAAGLSLRVRPEELDATAFNRLATRGRACVVAGDVEAGAALLDEAMRLWRGPAYATLGDSPLVREEAARLNEQRQAVATELVEARLVLGQHAEVVGELESLVREHPSREDLRAQLMTALHRQGRTAEALATYRDACRSLADDLGLEPGPRLRRLAEAIRAGNLPESPPPTPAELPAAPATFTGRLAELSALEASMPAALVTGVPGVGKTALALHWSHRVADRFPDGQLYVDLRGHDEPLTASAALGRLLPRLGVAAGRVPADTDERCALFRSTVRERRLLIVLDNAVSAEQVRPLVPAGPGCAVVVTARRRLAGLVADGFRFVPLGVLTDDETIALLSDVIGADRIAAEPAAARRLARLCDRLPLAVRIAAAKLATRPAWTLAELAERLTGEHGRLDQLHGDDWHVRASFELSYRDLPPRLRTAFRRLGLLDAPAGVAPWTLAALLDTDADDAEELAERLVDAQLIQPLGTDAAGQPRYRFHDLIRLYAAERAEIEEPPAELTAAVRRAYERLVRGLSSGPADWLRSERHTVAAAMADATGRGLDELSWRLAVGTTRLRPVPVSVGLRLDSVPGSVSRQHTLLFERLGHARERVMRLGRSAIREHRLGQPGWSRPADLRQAQALLAEADDVTAAAYDLGRLATAALRASRAGEAIDLLDEAAALVPANVRQLRIMFLRAIRAFYVHQGRAGEAVHLAARTVELARAFGDPRSEPGAVRGLAEAQLAAGDRDAAWSTVDSAIRLARQTGQRKAEGRALLTLADIDAEHSADHLNAAATVFAAAGADEWHRSTLLRVATG
ncbi:AfsR/SARP family transcriptional regulator [Fodinicola acaciae]|uniref:AfsR/SARP family transcriptional regulator n=1 Tax=Fodinicola acaciae TaxID=2681555 RepID=UPI0013D00BEB|nr:AfsR/SARP family transcriptional regulator [Fodinicola acaciae]